MKGTRFFDHLGHPFSLGPEIGKGGEGSVFEVVNSPDLVAKIYHFPPSQTDEAKLKAMSTFARKELCEIAAWPSTTLHERPGGLVRGIVMRKIRDFAEIHTLYGPTDRKRLFPDKDWRFLTHVSMNCAHAFDTLHASGIVMGDVNERNIFVSEKGFVALIDCDSYQFQCNGQSFPCKVGVPDFTPPELQGRSFHGVVRTPNHDNFGLAVLIFHLLFMSRHPFVGRYLGQGEMPMERAIREYRFAFSRSAHSYQMQTPIHAPPLSILSSELVDLFERAFSRQAAFANSRPRPTEWVAALGSFLKTLRTCNADIGHVFAPHLPNCAWCSLMRQGAPNFFVTVAFARGGGTSGISSFVLPAVWRRIDKIARPSFAYIRPVAARPVNATPWPATVLTAIPSMPVMPAILVSQPRWTGPVNLQAVPPKPVPPPILVSPPTWAGPIGLPPLAVKPAPLGILASALVWHGPVGVPPISAAPVLPTILSSPPAPPANLFVIKPQRRKQIAPMTRAQAVAIATCAACFVAFIPTTIATALIWGATVGPAGPVAWGFGLVVLLASAVSGAAALVLESQRRHLEMRLTEEYEEKLKKQEEEAPRKLAEWQKKLAAAQIRARAIYDDKVREWTNRAEAIRIDTQRQLEQWQAEIASQQAEARRRFEDELCQWQKLADNHNAEIQRQKEQWEAQVAAQQLQPRRRFEAEMREWHVNYEAYTAEYRRQQANWESQIHSQQIDARRCYAEASRKWQNQVDEINAELRRRSRAPIEWRQKLSAAEQNWANVATRFEAQFDAKKRELARLRDRHTRTIAEHAIEFQRLQQRVREIQFEDFLEQNLIAKHKIQKIGRGRIATLASYGIESALDVVEERLLNVPGFGQSLTDRLLVWRRSIEVTFTFNPATGIPVARRQEIDSKYGQARQQIESALLAGENELRTIATTAEKQLGQLNDEIKYCLARLAQADRDLNAVPPGLANELAKL